jgi:hypothetical protein
MARTKVSILPQNAPQSPSSLFTDPYLPANRPQVHRRLVIVVTDIDHLFLTFLLFFSRKGSS